MQQPPPPIDPRYEPREIAVRYGGSPVTWRYSGLRKASEIYRHLHGHKFRLKTNPLKYGVGKRLLVPVIAGYIPLDTEHFWEPMAGGANMTLAIRQTHPDVKCWLNDSSRAIANFWICLQNCPRQLQWQIGHELHHTESRQHASDPIDPEMIARAEAFYDRTRANLKRISIGDINAAARLYLATRWSYRNIFSSTFSPGRYRAHFVSNSSIQELESWADLLQGVRITCFDYGNVLRECHDTRILPTIYCDPPYHSARTYFEERSFDHDRFYGTCEYISMDARILISIDELHPLQTERMVGWKPECLGENEWILRNYELNSFERTQYGRDGGRYQPWRRWDILP